VTLLLDSQALVWWREGNRKLGPRVRAAIEREALTVATTGVACVAGAGA
jgi:PIN domain nuclease of toxin-antitoxin system